MRRVNHAIIAEKGRSDCLLAAWYDPTQPQSATVHRLETAVMEEVAAAKDRAGRTAHQAKLAAMEEFDPAAHV